MRNKKSKRLINSLFLFLLIIFFGITGYMSIEGYSFLQALYMTIITISTVGYGVVRPLSKTGTVFTVLLIIFSFTSIGVILQNIVSFFFDEELRKIIKRRRMERELKKLQGHVVVCGFGRNGRHAVEELLLRKEHIVIIEKNHEKLIDSQLLLYKNIYVLEGDATNEEILKAANVAAAKALITTLPVDADNVFVVLTAKELNPNLRIISRAADEHSESKLRRAGADYVIMPDTVGGHRMGKLVSQPDVIEFLDYLLIKSGDTVNIEEIPCNQLPKEFIGRSLSELDVRRRTGANIIGMKLPDGSYVFNPSAETKILRDSKLFVVGTPEQVKKLKQLLQNG
jgi:voltage-gated potassium channel